MLSEESPVRSYKISQKYKFHTDLTLNQEMSFKCYTHWTSDIQWTSQQKNCMCMESYTLKKTDAWRRYKEYVKQWLQTTWRWCKFTSWTEMELVNFKTFYNHWKISTTRNKILYQAEKTIQNWGRSADISFKFGSNWTETTMKTFYIISIH